MENAGMEEKAQQSKTSIISSIAVYRPAVNAL